jgi:hypothetical protein
MKPRNLSIPIVVAGFALVTVAGAALHSGHDAAIANETAPKLPSATHARQVLGATPRHIEWIAAPLGSNRILAFVVSPERSNRAPVVIVTAQDQAASDWTRAVADQVAAAGFLAVVPDVLTGEGPEGGDTDSFRGAGAVQKALARLGPREISRRIEAVRGAALELTASNGIAARLDLRPGESLIFVAVQLVSGKFGLSDQGLAEALTFLRKETNDHPVFSAYAAQNEHAMHLVLLAQAASKTGEIGRPGQPGGDTSYYQKQPNLPADFYTAKSTLANSKLRKEFVDIPVGEVKLHTWI